MDKLVPSPSDEELINLLKRLREENGLDDEDLDKKTK